MPANPLFSDTSPVIQPETRRRIKVSVWAYAYEFEDDPLVADVDFDRECRLVDLTISTDRPKLDSWFRANFSPDTGKWIRTHPELDKIKKLYHNYYLKG